MDKPICEYHSYLLVVKFYKSGASYYIGSHDMGFHGYNSKIGKILLEWRENEEGIKNVDK